VAEAHNQLRYVVFLLDICFFTDLEEDTSQIPKCHGSTIVLLQCFDNGSAMDQPTIHGV